MNSRLIRYFSLIIILISLSGWSEKVHRKINTSSVEILPNGLKQLNQWSKDIGDHASDADLRKKSDKTEFVKHFIDIDNYDDFIKNHRIEENFEAACAKYGKDFVIKNGTLPWSTDSTYQALVENFRMKNWNQAVLTIADLGHYVADGFMPLHTTVNYDGQLSDQTGIHSRFEEVMVDPYIDEISLKDTPDKKIDQVLAYVFDYLYVNNSKIEPILQADKDALRMSGGQYNETYYRFFWEKTKLLTVKQLRKATKTLATLIYTAWIEAGKPEIPEKISQK
jgi:hypothetical protein